MNRDWSGWQRDRLKVLAEGNALPQDHPGIERLDGPIIRMMHDVREGLDLGL